MNVPQNHLDRPVAVVGAGTLGRRIALMFAARGGRVRVNDPDADQAAAALDYVDQQLNEPSEKHSERARGAVEYAARLADAVDDAWLVVEAVPERLRLKQDVFAQLEASAPRDAILASNSSSYPSRLIVEGLSTTDRMLNTHFYMPPEQIAVDVMSCGDTSREVLEFVMSAYPEYGLRPFLVHRESTGFIFNRIWAAIKREALEVVAEQVSTPQDVDAMCMLNFGTKTGPFRAMDHIGLDVVYDIEEHYARENPALPTGPRELLRRYLDNGKLGVKSGEGFYSDYPTAEKAGPTGTPARHAKQSAARTGSQLLALGLADACIHSVDPTTGEASTLAAGLDEFPDGIIVDPQAGHIYWTNMGTPDVGTANDPEHSFFTRNGSIERINLDGTGRTTIVERGRFTTGKQLAADFARGYLYWCDREGMAVLRAALDGSDLTVLYRPGEDPDPNDARNHCVGIAIDPKRQRLYWTQKGAANSGQGRIFCAALDLPSGQDPAKRTDVETLWSALPEPIDLDFDAAGNLLWTDRGDPPTGNTLNRANPDHSDRSPEILSAGYHEAIGLVVDHDIFYVSDLSGAIRKIDPANGIDQELINLNGPLTGIAIAPI